MKNVGSVIVSWDFSHEKDKGILLIGERKDEHVDIVNVFQGKEAMDIYKKLTTRKQHVSL